MTGRPDFGADPATRRRAVQRQAAALAQACGTRSRLHVVGRDDVHGQAPHLLRETLVSLGGIFAHFGRYLSGRRDLLDRPCAIELESIPDWSEPLAAETIHQVIARDLGDAAGAFAFFEDSPFESRLVSQSHRALLADGRAVVVRVSRAELAADADHLDLLALVVDVIPHVQCSADAVRAVVEDFQQELRATLDARRDLEAFKELAADVHDFDRIAAPRAHESLSGRDVLTFEAPGVATVADHLRDLRSGQARGALARLVVGAWLQQALLGRVFPVIVRPEAIQVCGPRRISFSQGPFQSIEPEYQAAMREYLLKAETDPDRACACFLRQMRSGGVRPDDEGLRRRIRQTVAFHDDECSRGGGDEPLESLWVHCRLAALLGFVPLPHMPAFFRGLTGVARIAHALSPGEDVLRQGLEDVQRLDVVREVAGAVDPAELGHVLGEYLQLAVTMPQRLDGLLQQVSEGGARVRIAPPPAERRRQRPVSLLVIALALCCATVLLETAGLERSGTVWMKTLIVAALVTVAVAIVASTEA